MQVLQKADIPISHKQQISSMRRPLKHYFEVSWACPLPLKHTLPAQYARVVEKGEELPEFQHEYRGILFNVNKCQGICHAIEAYEPTELPENAYATGLLFWGIHETIDAKFAKKTVENRIDKYLDRYTQEESDEGETESISEISTFKEIPCASPEKDTDPGTVVVSNLAPIYSKKRKSSTILAEASFGADVVVLSTQGKFAKICLSEGSGWIERSNLGKKSR